MIDITIRAFSKAAWTAAAKTLNILDAKGSPKPNFDIDEIGFATLVSAVLDAKGVVITPAIMDTWFWVNIRITGAQYDADVDSLYSGETEDGYNFTKSKIAKFIRDHGLISSVVVNGKTIKAYEFGIGPNRIQLLDPRDYAAVRQREWLGGMKY